MRYVTPKGTAGWPKLFKPDTKFNAEGVYSTKLNVPGDDPKVQKLIEDLKEGFIEEFGAKAITKAKWPYETNDDGSITFKFKSRSKPEVKDAANQIMSDDTRLGSGAVIQVAGNVGFNAVSGNNYVTLYISKVKVHDLVEWSGDPFSDGDEGESTNDDKEVESKGEATESEDF